MTWAARVGEVAVGVLDMPLSVASMVCETAGCGWGDLNPEDQPGHLAAALAGARSWLAETAFDVELALAAAIPLGEALEFLTTDALVGGD